jgi:hypothetical protein
MHRRKSIIRPVGGELYRQYHQMKSNTLRAAPSQKKSSKCLNIQWNHQNLEGTEHREL